MPQCRHCDTKLHSRKDLKLHIERQWCKAFDAQAMPQQPIAQRPELRAQLQTHAWSDLLGNAELCHSLANTCCLCGQWCAQTHSLTAHLEKEDNDTYALSHTLRASIPPPAQKNSQCVACGQNVNLQHRCPVVIQLAVLAVQPSLTADRSDAPQTPPVATGSTTRKSPFDGAYRDSEVAASQVIPRRDCKDGYTVCRHGGHEFSDLTALSRHVERKRCFKFNYPRLHFALQAWDHQSFWQLKPLVKCSFAVPPWTRASLITVASLHSLAFFVYMCRRIFFLYGAFCLHYWLKLWRMPTMWQPGNILNTSFSLAAIAVCALRRSMVLKVFGVTLIGSQRFRALGCKACRHLPAQELSKAPKCPFFLNCILLRHLRHGLSTWGSWRNTRPTSCRTCSAIWQTPADSTRWQREETVSSGMARTEEQKLAYFVNRWGDSSWGTRTRWAHWVWTQHGSCSWTARVRAFSHMYTQQEGKNTQPHPGSDPTCSPRTDASHFWDPQEKALKPTSQEGLIIHDVVQQLEQMIQSCQREGVVQRLHALPTNQSGPAVALAISAGRTPPFWHGSGPALWRMNCSGLSFGKACLLLEMSSQHVRLGA